MDGEGGMGVLSVEVKDDIIVTINLKLMTIHRSNEILTQLKNIIAQHDKNLMLDLHNVESLDSTTISMFIELNNFLKESGKKLILMNFTPFVKKTFDMLHITKFFNIK
jgi:anti-anti-sigma factor